MTRKKKLVIAGVILSALVIIGTIGGIALAENPETTTVADKLAAKVAAILGIEEAKVQAAFEQARTELQSEALDNWLAQMVTDGRLTQAQADAYKSWLDAKPEGLEGIGPGPGMMRGFGGFRGGCGGFQLPRAGTSTSVN